MLVEGKGAVEKGYEGGMSVRTSQHLDHWISESLTILETSGLL